MCNYKFNQQKHKQFIGEKCKQIPSMSLATCMHIMFLGTCNTGVYNYMWHDQGNESDVGNIDFELHATTVDKFLMFYIVFEFEELFISLQQCSL